MRARSIKIAILLATICIVARPEAQAAAVVSGKYSITSWTDQDGLPLSQIWALTQTRDGFLWLATTAGLVRFDGQTFRLGIPGLPEGEVTTVRSSQSQARPSMPTPPVTSAPADRVKSSLSRT